MMSIKQFKTYIAFMLTVLQIPRLGKVSSCSARRKIGTTGCCINYLSSNSRIVFHWGIVWCMSLAIVGCTAEQEIKTIRPGVITVAVTSNTSTSRYDPQLWIRKYVEQFARERELQISWVVVPFNESWLLASRDEVDLVATNVANFADRVHLGASFSAPFLFERRALRINPEDEESYQHIDDFIGKTVGVVSGMAAERDVKRRAPDGVIVRTTDTFAQLYAEFDLGQLDAVAEAEYYALDGQVIPSHGDEVVLIDHHDLTPGAREESVFVISDNSENLLSAVNEFIGRSKFPL